MTTSLSRCEWANGSDLMREYHDKEWGVPVREDVKLFEFLLLDAFQAGLSWDIILRKREGFRIAFRDFDPAAVAAMADRDLDALMNDSGIIRNRAKIVAARANAVAFLDVVGEFGDFSSYFWSFVNDDPINNTWTEWQEIPAATDESRALSKDMKKRGFKFAGPTIIYAVMQSAGLVNDHTKACFRWEELLRGSTSSQG